MNKTITVKKILEVTNGRLIYGSLDEACEKFEMDTRKIENGDVFVGFKGQKTDGGTLYKEAFNAGAKGCIINEDSCDKIEKISNKFLIAVNDTVKAIQNIAKLKRQMYNIPVIAVTGSVGKTSTKDIVASVVSKKFKVLKTQGNLNNHIGLPMTILELDNHTAMVLEMGMNHLGEIKTLTNIAKPTIAIITNIGTAHIGNLKSRENILKAKLEILEGLKEDGILVFNNDNDLLNNWNTNYNKKVRTITYGISNVSDEMAENVVYNETNTSYELIDKEKKITINVPIGGTPFVYNSLAAVCVGRILKIQTEKIKEGIEEFVLTKMRMEVKKSSKGYYIVNDCYNANYDSMKSAIEYLSNLKGNRKIAILGDMLELGDFSKDLHEKVGDEIIKNKIDILITVGKESENISKIVNKQKITNFHFEKNQDAINKLQEVVQTGDVVLVKASNSMNFKEITEAIM